MAEAEEEVAKVEEEAAALAEAFFIAPTVTKMVTLKAIVLRRRGTPLKQQISVRKKVKPLKLCFLQLIVFKLKMILHGI